MSEQRELLDSGRDVLSLEAASLDEQRWDDWLDLFRAGVRGRGLNQTFTVRRISYGEGVERIFPTHSPRVEKIEVERQGSVRRAKLTYLRDRIGKGAMAVKEKDTLLAA